MNNPQFRQWLLLVSMCFFLSAGLPASAEIVSRLLPVADTALRELEPGNNLGSAQNLPVGVSANGVPRNRGLFAFDLSSIPTDAVFSSVKFYVPLVQVGPNSSASVFELRRVLVPWNEGNKPGLPATIGEATWNSRAHLQLPWGAVGGQLGLDFATEVSATAILAGTGTVSEFTSAGLIADTQYWVSNRMNNFGWVLMAQGEPAGSGKQVGSRENSSHQPVLELRYRSFSMYDIALAGDALRFSFDVDSNQTYAVEFRDSVETGQWTILTNIPSVQADSTIHITNQPDATPRYFRLRKP